MEQLFELEGREFPLKLCEKTVRCGSLRLRQLWMDTRDLGPRQSIRSNNFRTIIDLYHATCTKEETWEPDTCQTYLLARLMPHVRPRGSVRVFADAHLPKEAKKKFPELDLGGSPPIDSEKLAVNVRRALGIPELDEKTRTARDSFTDELLLDLQQEVIEFPDAAFEKLQNRWRYWCNGLGRRRGNTEKKHILDIMSYESRAAFFRAYSNTWWQLLYGACGNYLRLSPLEITFHALWHLTPVEPISEEPLELRYILCGHLLALHPVGGIVIASNSGQRLMEPYLQNPEDKGHRDRLYAGLELAAYHYQQLRDEHNSNRIEKSLVPMDSSFWASADTEKIDGTTTIRKRGMRRKATQKDNSN